MQIGVDDPVRVARALAVIGIEKEARRMRVCGETNENQNDCPFHPLRPFSCKN
jgi:hypothetical protein